MVMVVTPLLGEDISRISSLTLDVAAEAAKVRDPVVQARFERHRMAPGIRLTISTVHMICD